MTTALVTKTRYDLADPKSFKCFDATLIPLPVDEILRISQRALEANGTETPDTMVGAYELFQLTEILYRWIDENLYFRDWKYSISSIAFWEYERIVIEVEAHKKYSMVSLVLVKEELVMEDWWRIAKDGAMVTASDLLNWLGGLLNEINRRIDQWNFICKFAVPVFTSPLPRYFIVNDMLKIIWEKVVEESNYNGAPDILLGDNVTDVEVFEFFERELGYLSPWSLTEIFMEGWSHHDWGEKHDWFTWVDVEASDYDYSMIFSFYVSRKGCPFAFKVLDFGIDDPSQLFEIEEADVYIHDTIDEVESAMINWNNMVSSKTEAPSERVFRYRNDVFSPSDHRYATDKERTYQEVVKRQEGEVAFPFLQLKLPFD